MCLSSVNREFQAVSEALFTRRFFKRRNVGDEKRGKRFDVFFNVGVVALLAINRVNTADKAKAFDKIAAVLNAVNAIRGGVFDGFKLFFLVACHLFDSLFLWGGWLFVAVVIVNNAVHYNLFSVVVKRILEKSKKFSLVRLKSNKKRLVYIRAYSPQEFFKNLLQGREK